MYDTGSIHVPNKYVVGFWGDAVTGAIQYLSEASFNDPIFKTKKDGELYTRRLLNWLSIFSPGIKAVEHPDGKGLTVQPVNVVELLWACENVKLPGSVIPKFNTDIRLDTHKSIMYPLITGTNGPGDVTITVVEERSMMFYQFFNALMNQFFDVRILKPRSSFHRLGMYIAVMDGNQQTVREANGTDAGKYVYDSVPMQVFEFNSVVPADIGTLSYSNAGEAKKATFQVTMKCPNMFHDGFKTMGTLRGLANNTTDSELISQDMGKMNGRKYKEENFMQ